MIVADTCVIFHLFNETNLTERARAILDLDSNWIFPSLWKEEYANVLSKIARKNGFSTKEIVEHFNHTVNELRNGEIVVDPAKALEISIYYKISVYDSHFIALAIEFNTFVITEDKEILKNCSEYSISMQDFLKLGNPA